jgi:CRISPR-associated protein Csb3
MTGITLSGDPRRLITHLALYGLAAISEDAGHTGLRMSWTPGMNPHPRLDADEDPDTIARSVHTHAQERAQDWLAENITLSGTPRGLMSPRLSAFTDDGAWHELQDRRHRVLDSLTDARQDLDLKFIGALGEPCYWRFDPKNKRLQDDAANRLEMQPRNNGAEFIGTRLSRLAEHVAARDTGQVLDGLLGNQTRDEVGKNAADSRTATGLDAPGPADNAIVWCALWGISQTFLAIKSGRKAVTSVCLRESQEYVYLPVWAGRWHPARLRSILASSQLRDLATAALAGAPDLAPAAGQGARQWLAACGVTAIMSFPINISGSDNAPERRAGTGRLHPIGTTP